MKLSPKLIEILVLMNSGWELGRSNTSSLGWWLQKGGIGKGGETNEIHGRTNMYMLTNSKLIASNGYGFPTQKYYLTEEGKQFLKDIGK